jgi:hypothetical protein
VAKGHGERLSRKQELAVAALITEPTIGAAAAKVGVHERTMRTWLADDGFRGAFRKECRSIVTVATGKLQSITSDAVAALGKNLRAKRPADQLKAVDLVLGHVVRLAELCDLTDEVEKLKVAMAGGDDGTDDAPQGTGEATDGSRGSGTAGNGDSGATEG